MTALQSSSLCECGCGLPAPIAKQNLARFGWVKGQPKRFRRWHHKHNMPIKSYRHVGIGDAKSRLLHQLRAERALGHPLPPKAVVHHADGSKNDDAPLVICQDQAYHMLLHARMRIVAAGGNPNTDKFCARCKELKTAAGFSTPSARLCRSCVVVNNAERRERRTVAA